MPWSCSRCIAVQSWKAFPHSRRSASVQSLSLLPSLLTKDPVVTSGYNPHSSKLQALSSTPPHTASFKACLTALLPLLLDAQLFPARPNTRTRHAYIPPGARLLQGRDGQQRRLCASARECPSISALRLFLLGKQTDAVASMHVISCFV